MAQTACEDSAEKRGTIAGRDRGNRLLKLYIRYPLEAVLLAIFFGFVSVLPIDAASGVGGFLGRTLGPKLPRTRQADRNLRLAFPEKSDPERADIIRGMWENLGRVAAEYPHLDRIAAPDADRVEVVNPEYIYTLTKNGAPAILVGGHLGNWEILSIFAARLGIDMTSVVREQNNKLSQKIIDHYRRSVNIKRIKKGSQGAKQALVILRRGGILGLLFDQKMNDGIPVRFFGCEAMTAAAPAQLAIRLGCPLIPVRVERLRGARFRITCYSPVERAYSADRHTESGVLMRKLNKMLEDWIRERPEQWLWVHRRWPEETYRAARL
jgi:KDO2-lipid IV(A) lauroyltransferase